MACQCWWWRWVVTLAAFNVTFLCLGLLYNYSILFVSLKEEFHAGSAATGWVGSVAIALTGLCSPLTVILERKLSKRTIVNLGVVVFSAGLFVTSFVPALGYAYFTFGVMTGVGANFINQPTMVVVLEWFARKNFSRAMVFTLLGSTCGMLVFSPVLTTCISHYGWRGALRILGGGILVLGVANGMFLTDPPTEDYTAAPDDEPPDEKHELENMGKMKQVPEGGTKGSDYEKRSSKGHGADLNEGNNDLQVNNIDSCGFLHLIKSLEVWLWSIGVLFGYIGWNFFNINFASFMKGLDFSSSQTASAIMIFACGEIGGKLLIGVIGDRLPFMSLYLLVISCIFGTVVLGLLAIVKTFTTVAVVAVVSGLLRSCIHGTTIPSAAQLFHEAYGAHTVEVLSFVPPGIGTLISAPISGVLYDVTGDYVLGIFVIAAIFVCASAALLGIPLHRRFGSRGLSGSGGSSLPVPL
ncbi:monocarboxylate transporter 13-like [Patiria miniata]|uniref:Major facilitator superfamily (MFS) profile domain-containing protein n=1 Tax=Patiria miniata TaxID=46514 RepID=A0A914A0P8_PATMI|nr:monocarboxylate transporter 13-like [Patiria miniata]XP_038057254.1 monocarboxylate transporter 13-like [Patiria miniata]